MQLTSAFVGQAHWAARKPVTAAPSASSGATRSVTCMAKKKGVRVIVTLECTEARAEGGTPSRYVWGYIWTWGLLVEIEGMFASDFVIVPADTPLKSQRRTHQSASRWRSTTNTFVDTLSTRKSNRFVVLAFYNCNIQPFLQTKKTLYWQCIWYQPLLLTMSLSPKDKAMPCVLERILIKPPNLPLGNFSMETFTNASSPKTERAYRFADKKAMSPSRADSGERHLMFVHAMMWSRKALGFVKVVL